MANSIVQSAAAEQDVHPTPIANHQGSACVPLEDFHLRSVNYNTSIPKDGLIYQRIRHYQRTQDESLERQWWSELTESKTTYLKQFWSPKNSYLCSAMEELLQIPSIWLDLEIGMLPKIIALHCNEVRARGRPCHSI